MLHSVPTVSFPPTIQALAISLFVMIPDVCSADANPFEFSESYARVIGISLAVGTDSCYFHIAGLVQVHAYYDASPCAVS